MLSYQELERQLEKAEAYAKQLEKAMLKSSTAEESDIIIKEQMENDNKIMGIKENMKKLEQN